MEAIFQNVITRAQAQARQYGSAAMSGAEAVAQAGGRPAPRNINATMFADGDIVEVPKFPEAGNPQESDAQWLSKPLSRGGDPVLSVLCKVTTVSGAVVVKELFAGTLVKSALNETTQQTVEASGTAHNAVVGLGLVEDMYKAVAGQKLKFSNPQTFQTRRRDFNGVRPDRIANTTVFQIDFA